MPPYSKKGGKQHGFGNRGPPQGGGGGRGGGHPGGGRGGGGGGGPHPGGGRGGGRGRGGGGGHHQGRGGGGGGGGGSGGGGATGDIMATMLRLVFEKQQSIIFEADSGMLNLSNFAECPDLSGQAKKAVDFNTVAFCKALAVAIRDMVGSPRAINLDNNNIASLIYFVEALINEGIADGVHALSVASNRIKDFSFLKKLRGLQNLDELVLQGNPVAEQPNYLSTIAKGLPNLKGLDFASLERAPLALPWPKPAQLDETSISILQFLESGLFAPLTEGNVDAVHGLYHSDALLTLSIADQFNVNTNPPKGADKKLLGDLNRLGSHLKDRNRNSYSSNKGSGRIARGPLDICVMLKEIYGEWFRVLHEIDGNGDVQLIGDAVKVPIALVTIHGKMMWTHKGMDETQSRCLASFDRTFSLVEMPDGWRIANDLLHLRRPKDEPVFLGTNASRCGRIARKVGTEPELVAAVCSVASSDLEMMQVIAELQNLDPAVLFACVEAAGGDAAHGVLTARVVAHKQLDAPSAYAALQRANFDVATCI